jgi:hypothetical protein
MPAVAVATRCSVGSYALIGLPRLSPALIDPPESTQISGFRRLIVFEFTNGLSDLYHLWRRATTEVPAVSGRQCPTKSFDFRMIWIVLKCGRLERRSYGH